MASAHMENEHERDPDTNLWLLGDSGYPLQPWLMTPIANPRNNAETHYNKMHTSTRNKVERCIGVLKNRFRCLIHEQKLRYTHTKAGNIISSCAVLHNFLNSRQVDIDFDVPNQDVDIQHNTDNQNRLYLQRGKVIRNALVQSMYANRTLDQ